MCHFNIGRSHGTDTFERPVINVIVVEEISLKIKNTGLLNYLILMHISGQMFRN